MARLVLLDLFSGIGGFSLAFERTGFTTAAFSEIEAFPCRVLEHRFPGITNLGDVSEITPEQIGTLGPIDVVSFGSPCQDWSVAGKRLGLKGHRSSLFHEAIRIIRLCRPRFAVFENVPGLFSSARGWDFAAVLDEMEESGALDIAWRVLDAQWFGVPQRRRRIFLVADFRGERAGEILSISEGVFRDTPPGREARSSVAALTSNGVGTYGADDNQGQAGHLFACQGTNVGPSGALRSGNGHVTGGVPFLAHALTDEQSGQRNDPTEETFVAQVAPPIRSNPYGDHDACEGHLVTHALTSEGHDASEDGTGRGTPLVPLAFAENQRAELRVDRGNPQLTSGGGKPGQGYPAVAFTERTRADGRNFEYLEDQAYALTNPGSGGRTHSRQLVQGMAVRRLTPTECERLQGFPDGWTGIPGASDSARYRALGNSVAMPVVQWIAERMAKELDRD